MNTSHAHGRTQGIALNQTSHNPDFFFDAQFVHVTIMLERSSIARTNLTRFLDGHSLLVYMARGNKMEFPSLLKHGFHLMTVAQLREEFVTKIRQSTRRAKIMDGLEQVIQRLTTAGIEAELWIDGSFTTEKIDPMDSDVVAKVSIDFMTRATPAQKATLQWFGADLFTSHLCHSHVFFEYPMGHPEHQTGVWDNAYWLRQFGFSRKDEPKGIAVVKVP